MFLRHLVSFMKLYILCLNELDRINNIVCARIFSMEEKSTADIVKHLLEIRGWTRAKLATKAGVTKVVITRLLNKETSDPKLSILKKLAVAFEVDIGHLTGEHPTPQVEDFVPRLPMSRPVFAMFDRYVVLFGMLIVTISNATILMCFKITEYIIGPFHFINPASFLFPSVYVFVSIIAAVYGRRSANYVIFIAILSNIVFVLALYLSAVQPSEVHFLKSAAYDQVAKVSVNITIAGIISAGSALLLDAWLINKVVEYKLFKHVYAWIYLCILASGLVDSFLYFSILALTNQFTADHYWILIVSDVLYRCLFELAAIYPMWLCIQWLRDIRKAEPSRAI